MNRENSAAVFTVSVDVPHPAVKSISTGQFAAILDDLLTLFDEFKVPVTWGISQPAASPWTATICRRSARHEIALLGDASWLVTNRTRFVNEFGRRTESAENIGIRVRTLLLRGVTLPSELDMLVRRRVSLVRADIESALRSKSPYQLRPISARYGIWQVPASAVIAGRRSWWPGAEASSAIRAIREVSAHGGFCHLVVDLATAMREAVSVIGAVRRALRTADAARRQGKLHIESLHSAAARLLPQATTPTQSVLRRAA